MRNRAWLLYPVKVYYISPKYFSLLPGIDQTPYVYSDKDEGGFCQNCKFHEPWGRGSCAKAWPNKSWSEKSLFL